jgi:hypothetical protein
MAQQPPAAAQQHAAPGAPPALQPSSTYKFAKQPRAAIAKAIKDSADQKSPNPRVCWKALVDATAAAGGGGKTPAPDSLSCEQFSSALKGFGTGIQLTGADVAIAFGLPSAAAKIDFAAFQGFTK